MVDHLFLPKPPPPLTFPSFSPDSPPSPLLPPSSFSSSSSSYPPLLLPLPHPLTRTSLQFYFQFRTVNVYEKQKYIQIISYRLYFIAKGLRLSEKNSRRHSDNIASYIWRDLMSEDVMVQSILRS